MKAHITLRNIAIPTAVTAIIVGLLAVLMKSCKFTSFALLSCSFWAFLGKNAVHSSKAVPLPAGNRTAATVASTKCSPPISAADALRPYCYLPDTVSKEAEAYFKTKTVAMPATNISPQQAQAAFNAITGVASAAAIKGYYQSILNSTIAGVAVAIGTPLSYVNSTESRQKLLVYIHGGAYIKGSCYHLWHIPALAAQNTGLQVLCVEYSLAPEHPFPAGLNDVFQVYQILSKQYRHIGLLGDSAGAGLILALLQKIKQRTLDQLPAAVALLGPWADVGRTGDSIVTLSGVDPILQYDINLKPAALAYVANNVSKMADPLVSPLRAVYSKPFPPVLIQVGTRDLLLSQSVLLYRKLVAAGLMAVFSPYEAMWHVWQGALQVPEAHEAGEELAAFFKLHL
jgi:acetyl esterase/lipase